MTEDNKALLARKLGLDVVQILPLDKFPKHLLEKIPYSFVRKNLVLPILDNEKGVTVAISDPLNVNAIDELRFMLDREVKAVFTPEEKVLSAINTCYHQEEGGASRLLANLSEELETFGKKEADVSIETYDLLETKEEVPLVRLLNLILSEAINEGASDIHFEPFEDDLRIRYRIDGVLQNRHAPSREYQAQLLTRIKVLAKLDIAEHRLPQDGRIKLKMGGKEIDLRVSTVPISHGERIVLRILDKGNVILGLEDLGMLPATLDAFRERLSYPEGIVLVTGPTGSGKTTTLYSALFENMNDEINIMTVEDPVEYKLKGIAQIAVHPKIGLNFAAGLRHILRQDPDIVMIGEIRDAETAEIAIQAALTGHLVLSTLHTNDAASAIPRLIDMGVEPYLLSSTIVGVLAQRLVRKICPECRESYVPSEDECLDFPKKGKFYRGKGCKNCFQTGYKGRCGIYELLTVDNALQTQIAKRADAAELRRIAKENGLVTLWEHGVHLVQAGVTTIEEVRRVTRKY